MTREDKKRILRRYNEILFNIDRLTDKYATIYTNAVNVVVCSNGMPTAHNGTSRTETEVIKMSQVLEELETEERKKIIIDNALKNLTEIQEDILRQTEINGLSLYRYSLSVRKDYKYIIKLHNRSLDNLSINI